MTTYRINLINEQFTRRNEIGTADTIAEAKAIIDAHFAARGFQVFGFEIDGDHDAADFLAAKGCDCVQGEVVRA